MSTLEAPPHRTKPFRLVSPPLVPPREDRWVAGGRRRILPPFLIVVHGRQLGSAPFRLLLQLSNPLDLLFHNHYLHRSQRMTPTRRRSTMITQHAHSHRPPVATHIAGRSEENLAVVDTIERVVRELAYSELTRLLEKRSVRLPRRLLSFVSNGNEQRVRGYHGEAVATAHAVVRSLARSGPPLLDDAQILYSFPPLLHLDLQGMQTSCILLASLHIGFEMHDIAEETLHYNGMR